MNSAHIWKKILNNIGTIIVFIMLGAAIYVFYLVISVIVSFIPLLGMIIQYGLSFTLAAAFGLTFMSIFSENKNFSDALSEGFSFTFSNFWKVVLYGLIIGILNLMITALILSIPSFILGIYVFFSLESNQEIATSFVANMVFTFGFGAFLLAFIYTQALSQVAYGILYYNLHELKHNTYLQQKIDQIGLND